MAVVERKAKHSTDVMNRHNAALAKAYVKKSHRKSSQKYSSHLLPEKVHGSRPIKYSRRGSDKPKIWYVSNKKSGKDKRKVMVTAVTPRQAASKALKLANWGSSRAYVADGRGLGAVVSFRKVYNEKAKRHTLKATKEGKPYIPYQSDDDLSSSEGVEHGVHDYHEVRTKRKYVKSGQYKGRSKSKSKAKTATTAERPITEKAVETAVKNAAKEASEEASQGNKRVASSAAKEAVKEVLAANPTKASSKTAAKSVATEAKKHAQASAKSSGADAATAKAAGEAAQHAVQKAVTPRQTTSTNSKASEEERKDLIALIRDLKRDYEKYIDYGTDQVDYDEDALDTAYMAFIKHLDLANVALKGNNWRNTLREHEKEFVRASRQLEATIDVFGEDHNDQRLYKMEDDLDKLVRRIAKVHKTML